MNRRMKWIPVLCLLFAVLTVGSTFARYATTLSDGFRLNIIAEIYKLTLNADHGKFSDGTEQRVLTQAANKNFGVQNDITRDETIDGTDTATNTYQFLGWTYEQHPTELKIDFGPKQEIIVTARDTTLYAVWLREGTLTEGLFDDIGYVEGETTDLTIPGYVQSADGGTWYEITSIPNSEFRDDDTLQSVVIPDTVTSIGSSVFWSCNSLTSVIIPDSVTTIGADAFRYCQKLESVTIPSGVTQINDRTFYDCRSITSLVVPDGVTYIGSQAFLQCYSMRNLTIPASVQQINGGAFTFAGNHVGGIIITYDGTKAQWEKITDTTGQSQNVWGGGSAYKVICTDGEIVGSNFVASAYDLLPEEDTQTSIIDLVCADIDDAHLSWYPISNYDDMLPRVGEAYCVAFQPNKGYGLAKVMTVYVGDQGYTVYTDGIDRREIPADGSALPPMPTFDPASGILTIPAALLTEDVAQIRIIATAAPLESAESETNCVGSAGDSFAETEPDPTETEPDPSVTEPEPTMTEAPPASEDAP